MADGFVLAKDTAEGTAAEKDGAAAARAADAGFLPKMRRRAGNHGQCAHAAKPSARGLLAQGIAFAGTEIT